MPCAEGKIKEFHCIRALFAVHSEVFRAMLYGPMIEGQKNARVRLDDITPEAFEYLQRLFYGTRPCISEFIKYNGCLETLLNASRKYLLPHLEAVCRVAMTINSRRSRDSAPVKKRDVQTL